MAKVKTTEDVFEIRGPGGVGETSHVPFCGHALPILKDMAKYGYILYCNGKRVKLSELNDADVRKAYAV